MPVGWDTFGPLFRNEVMRGLDEIERRRDLANKPCSKTESGKHEWHRKPSIVRGYGFDECIKCKATKD